MLEETGDGYSMYLFVLSGQEQTTLALISSMSLKTI